MLADLDSFDDFRRLRELIGYCGHASSTVGWLTASAAASSPTVSGEQPAR